MTKLFIDVVGSDRRHLDFSGQLFLRVEEAAEAARLVSLDLSISENSPWVGSEVQVKDEVGRCLFTCPVRQLQ
jgi:hypothetical protein